MENLFPSLNEILYSYPMKDSSLIPLLQKTQEKYGYISLQTVEQIAEYLKITENQVFGVASFYSQFKFVEPGKCTVKVCMGTACHVRGSQNILNEFKRWLKINPQETTEDKMFTLETVNCVGACALGPIVIFDEDYQGKMKIKNVEELIQKYRCECEESNEDHS
ncbi:MAG: hypothetical protein A2V66_11260 [Ignavibacteria bacterium RBG_13_36_8]|nr:MAG: hypothetical protein A2V66_11260 [Ignavibacteria bacterium RBG_13_36_8]